VETSKRKGRSFAGGGDSDDSRFGVNVIHSRKRHSTAGSSYSARKLLMGELTSALGVVRHMETRCYITSCRSSGLSCDVKSNGSGNLLEFFTFLGEVLEAEPYLLGMGR
jgi:hypothetical protein